MKTLRNNRGFTLIEIIISIGLMAVIFLMMNQTMEDVTWSRNKVISQSEDSHVLQVVFSRMFDDINSAFLADTTFQGDETQAPTGFVADENSMHFTTMTGVHIVENHKDSNQHNVSYYLKSEDDQNYLMRRSTDHLLPDLQRGGKAFAILEGVKELRFEYYDPNKRSWRPKWDTDSITFAGRMPQRVRVTLTVYGEPKSEDDSTREEFSYEWTIPVEMYEQKINF